MGIEFSHYFAVSFERLPDVDALREHTRLSGDRDIVLVQVGSAYTRRILLPDTRRVHQLRDDVGRRVRETIREVFRLSPEEAGGDLDRPGRHLANALALDHDRDVLGEVARGGIQQGRVADQDHRST